MYQNDSIFRRFLNEAQCASAYDFIFKYPNWSIWLCFDVYEVLSKCQSWRIKVALYVLQIN